MKLALQRFSRKQRARDDIAKAFARCFRTHDGQIVLEQLHQQTLFRITDPMTSQDNLRFLEGQRQLVLWICQMIATAHTPDNTQS